MSELVARLTRIRATEPDAIARALAGRRRRPLLRDGKLFLVAADHTARGVLAAGGDPRAMADRGELLTRLVEALAQPQVDGVLATADIVDDLALLGALDDKIVFGSMNRGGLAGSVFELDDRFTGYTATAIAGSGLDGGKLMLRVADDDPATVRTMAACAQAIDALGGLGLPAMVEGFASRTVDCKTTNDAATDAPMRGIAITAGRGGTAAGLGQALSQFPEALRYHQARNEQSMVQIAVGYARMKDRLATFACTSSIGPGATNMVTGAALATINRIPVLLLPGDVFASRTSDPVLQQLEGPSRGDVSVNDTFQSVSRYWDRITRPEQIVPAALNAMRVLTDQAETGAVTLSLPQDVQAEAFEVPAEFLAKRVWHIERRPPDAAAFVRAIELINAARRPLIVAGGGVIYSGATDMLRTFAERSGIPVAETQAGKGSLRYDHALALGAIGATGTLAANRVARDADVVIGIATRWTHS